MSRSEFPHYGKLAFDIFALVVRNETTQSSTQIRNSGTPSLDSGSILVNQKPYIDRSLVAMDGNDSPDSCPSPEKVGQVIVPHQTLQEREISETADGVVCPIWLRTCYKPELQERYDTKFRTASKANIHPIYIDVALDNESIYCFENWKKILLRIPMLTNTGIGCEEDTEGLYDTQGLPPIEAAVQNARNVIFLVDEEALLKSEVKVIWLGRYGNVEWESILYPDDIDGITGLLFRRMWLEVMEYYN